MDTHVITHLFFSFNGFLLLKKKHIKSILECIKVFSKVSKFTVDFFFVTLIDNLAAFTS